MSDTYARVMKPGDGPAKRRAARSGAATGTGYRARPERQRPRRLKRAGRGRRRRSARAVRPKRRSPPRWPPSSRAARRRPTGFLAFEDVPAPKRLAPYATAIAATVQRDGADVAWGRLVLLYDPDGQEGWDGVFRLVAYIRAEVEPEIAADPLLGEVGWSWLSEALDRQVPGYAQPSGTVTRVITEGFGPSGTSSPSPGSSCAPPGPRAPRRPQPDHRAQAIRANGQGQRPG